MKGMPDLYMIGSRLQPAGILEVAKARKMAGDIKIIGFDEDRETLKAIGSGEIQATVVQDPFMYGYRSVEGLAAKAKGDDSKLLKEPIPYRVITKDGGPDEEVQTPAGKVVVKNLKVADFEAKLRADLESAKKK